MVLATFFEFVSLSKGNKNKNEQTGLHKTKNLVEWWKLSIKWKLSTTEWENIFAKHKFIKGLICKEYKEIIQLNSFSSVPQLCLTLCGLMDSSTPLLPVHHQLPEPTQTYVHRVGNTIQSSHPLSSPSAPTFNLSQNQGLFKWVTSHQVAKVLQFQLQHQSFQWTLRNDFP